MVSITSPRRFSSNPRNCFSGNAVTTIKSIFHIVRHGFIHRSTSPFESAANPVADIGVFGIGKIQAG